MMNRETLPVGLTTAALLKTQLDQGKDYFDLLVPFVERAISGRVSEVVQPQHVRDCVAELSSLQIPLRTVVVLLDRLVKGNKLRKEAGAYFVDPDFSPIDQHHSADATAQQFQELGSDFLVHAGLKGVKFINAAEALEALSAFLEENGVSLLLGDKPSVRKQSRKTSIAAASFVKEHITPGVPENTIITAFLQGLILRRAVLLSDIATLRRRLDRVVIYLDTRHLLSLAGLYGELELEASREACRVLRAVGATLAAFDVTLTEMRRILAVYEDRIDSSAGRASLDYTPLTRHFFHVRATRTDIAMWSALLEVSLRKEGVATHLIPQRIAEHVEDETELAKALRDWRYGLHTDRENHDVDCVAGILTLRHGDRPVRLEDAQAVFAATGHVVNSVMEWWKTTKNSGFPPIIAYNALLNYCWLKQPAASSAMLRHEMAAVCADVLKPSREVWTEFVTQLQRMVTEEVIDSDEAAALLIDDLSAKYVVDAESNETLEGGSMVMVIDRLRAQQQLDLHEQAEQLKALAREEQLRLQAQIEETRRMSDSSLALQAAEYSERISQVTTDMSIERARADALYRTVERVADIIAFIASSAVTGTVALLVVVLAIFPVLDSNIVSVGWQAVAKAASAIFAMLGGVFGFAAVPLGKTLRNTIRMKLVGRRGAVDANVHQLPEGGTGGQQVR